ncbi:hypothetical protein, partial [Streptomyces diastaticus]|uniref:hypothetical protein n=1 Tax=Streptomyces diastaticus TaxID=1956 RepID=UPI00364BB8A5
VLVWPGLMLFTLLRYRRNVAGLIDRTRAFSTPAGSLEFAEEVRELRETVESHEGERDQGSPEGEPAAAAQAQADRTAYDIYRDIATTAPEAAVMGAWLHVEKKLKDAADRLYADEGGANALSVSTSGIRTLNTRMLLRGLERKGWEKEWVEIANDLRRVRNHAAHQTSISPVTAREYVESCEFLVLTIDDLVSGH